MPSSYHAIKSMEYLNMMLPKSVAPLLGCGALGGESADCGGSGGSGVSKPQGHAGGGYAGGAGRDANSGVVLRQVKRPARASACAQAASVGKGLEERSRELSKEIN